MEQFFVIILSGINVIDVLEAAPSVAFAVFALILFQYNERVKTLSASIKELYEKQNEIAALAEELSLLQMKTSTISDKLEEIQNDLKQKQSK